MVGPPSQPAQYRRERACQPFPHLEPGPFHRHPRRPGSRCFASRASRVARSIASSASRPRAASCFWSRRRCASGPTRVGRELRPPVAHADGHPPRRLQLRAVPRVGRQRRADGDLLLRRRDGNPSRGARRRAVRVAARCASGCRRARRDAGSRRLSTSVVAPAPRYPLWLGRSDGDRHRVRRRHPHAAGKARAGRAARAAARARRHRRPRGHRRHRALLLVGRGLSGLLVAAARGSRALRDAAVRRAHQAGLRRAGRRRVGRHLCGRRFIRRLQASSWGW